MLRWHRALWTTLIVFCVLSGQTTFARAQITFYVGPGALQPPENVLMDSSSGFNVYGHTNQSNEGVTFTSDENILSPSQGQARVEAADGKGYQFLAINLTDPKLGFKEIEFNLNVFKPAHGQANGTVFIDVYGLGMGVPVTSPGFAISSAGQNFFSIEAGANTWIQKVDFRTNKDVLDTRQIRMGGVGPTSVPEGPSIAMLGVGLIPVAAVMWKRLRVKA